MNRTHSVVFAVLVVALFLLSGVAAVVQTGRSLPSISSSTLSTTSVSLPGGYQLPYPGGQAKLASDLQGGVLAPAGQSPQGLESVVASIEGPSMAKAVGEVPRTTWAAITSAAKVAQGGGSEAAVRAALEQAPQFNPATSSSDELGIAITFILVGLVIGCAVGGAIGCLIGAVAGGIVAAIVILVGNLMNQYNAQRAAAGVEMETIMGGLQNVLLTQETATKTLLNDLNATYTALTWEAANAALTQLGNSTFNYALDAFQSGILPQLASTVNGVIGNMAGAVAAYLNGTGALYGPNGFYGTQGIACTISINAPFINTISDPNLYSGYSASSPCFAETGTVGNEQWSGTANPTVSPGVYPGQAMSYGLGGGHHDLATEYYIPHDTYIDQAYMAWVAHPTSGIVGLQFIPASGIGSPTWYNYTTNNSAFEFTGPSGIYYVNELAGCVSYVFSTCQTPNLNVAGDANAVPIGVSVLPVNPTTAAATSLAASFNLTGPVSGDHFNSVGVGCGTPFGVTISAPHTNALPIQPCGPSENYTITQMSTMLQAAVNVGDAYWAFLRAQGYYNELQIPSRCVLPNPADIIAPNVNGGYAYLASLNLTSLLALYYGYLGSLSATFNATANLTTYGFCDHTVVCPNGSTDLTACEGVVGLGRNVPVLALGDIYVPPAQCVADLGHACTGEDIANPNTWGIVNVTQLWEPATGTLTFVLNQTMELPYANPSSLVYSANNTSRGLICQTGFYNVYGCAVTNTTGAFGIPGFLFHVAGNSTDAASSIYPTDSHGAYGVGFAARLTGCADIQLSNFTGDWSQAQSYTLQRSTCSFNETQIQSWVTNYTCIWDTASCAPPPPPPPPGSTGLCGTSTLTAWYDSWIGALVSGVAAPFQGIPFIGPTLGCILGWGAFVLIFVIAIIVIFYIVRAVRDR